MPTEPASHARHADTRLRAPNRTPPFASAEAAWVTGATLHVNGGMAMA